MSNTELLIQEVRTLPQNYTDMVLSVVNSLKKQSLLMQIADAPEPSQTDPTANAIWYGLHYGCWHSHIPNAATLAAMEEGEAILRGEIPVKWHNTPEELFAHLNSLDEEK